MSVSSANLSLASEENSLLEYDKKIKRENKAMSAVAISWPLTMTAASTLVISRFLSRSMFILERPVPSQIPFRNSRLSMSMLFLNSSRCTSALAHCATASASAGKVELTMLGGVFSMMKKAIKECPSSDLPEPFGPKRLRIGKFFV